MADIERIRCGSGNCFLISQDGSSVLVDTSRTAYREKILRVCANRNVRLIVLTHGHVDHIQNAAFLAARLNVPIAMHVADRSLIQDNMKQAMQARNLAGKMLLRMIGRTMKTDAIEPFIPAVLLKEGDSLSRYGVDVRIVELPGHTRGSIGLKLGDTDLIVGDALMNMFVPCRSIMYHDAAAVTMSAHKISACGVKRIHFGHGVSAKNRMW